MAEGGSAAKSVVVKTVTKKIVGRVRHTVKVNNSAHVVLDKFVFDEINMAELPVFLVDRLDLSAAELDVLTRTVGSEGLMEMGTTGVVSTDCLAIPENHGVGCRRAQSDFVPGSRFYSEMCLPGFCLSYCEV